MKTLKFTLVLLVALTFASKTSNAQYVKSCFKCSNRSTTVYMQRAKKHQVGLMMGATHQLTDINTSGLVNLANVRPAIGLEYRYSINKFFNINANMTYSQFSSSDSEIGETEFRSNDWYRLIRNLHYKTNLLEVALSGEYNILRYAPGQVMKNRFTPYVSAGVGIIAFNPKAEYNGEWYSLQPLGTEGQGNEGYQEKYNRVAVVLPFRVGFKYNVTTKLTLSSYLGYTWTGTDYIDDVSTVYADPADMKNEMSRNLGMRAGEKFNPEVYGDYIHAGSQRGDAEDNDSYWTFGVTMSYTISIKSDDHKKYQWK